MQRPMKNSGTHWLGFIPETWGVNSVDSLYTLRNEKVSDRDYPPLSVSKLGIIPQIETAAKTDDHDNRKLVKKGDFVINSRSDRRGSCGVSMLEGSVSLINTVLKPRDSMNPQYYNWLFHSDQFADEFFRWGHGIVDDLWTTGWREMRNIVLPTPLLSEQKAIADFLDKKCAAIDSAIETAKKEIDTYEEYMHAVITQVVTKGLDCNVEMKESTVEWVDFLPKNWGISKVKYETILRTTKGMYNPESNDNFIGLENIVGNRNNLIKTDSQYNAGIADECRKGDVLFSKLRPYLYKVLISPLDGFCTGELINFKSFSGDKRFLRYWLIQQDFIDTVNRSTYGSKMPRCAPEFVLNMPIVLPPLDEQNRIANYLDEKCSNIEELIIIKQQIVNTLIEYKKSLIYAYVTGKKEVSNG